MRSISTSLTVVLMTLACFTFASVTAPSTASAKWHDESGKLEGDFPTTAVIIAGVAIVGAVTYLIIKSGGDDKDESKDEKTEETTSKSTEKEDEDSELTSRYEGKTVLASSMVSPKQPAVGLYLGLEQDVMEPVGHESASSISDVTFKAGLSFSF